MQKTRIFFPKDENLREKSTLFRIYNSLYVIEWDTNQNSENEKGTDLRYLQTVPNQSNIQVQQKTHTSFILIKWRRFFNATRHSETLFEAETSEFCCEMNF